VSQDARNSIYLWIGALTFAGLFWAALRFDLPGGAPASWAWLPVGIAAAIEVARLTWGFWKRRASSPDNPNLRGR